MPDGSRIVHIGPHKTGTSSLQALFFAARGEAAVHGVLYESEGKHAMTAVLAALELPSPWSAERSLRRAGGGRGFSPRSSPQRRDASR